MIKKRQPPVFIVICVIVIAISFFAGQHFINATHKKNLPSVYQGALPSIGPLTTIKQMNVAYDGDFALAAIEQSALEQIKIGQKVVLYDNEGNVLPLGGEVKGFTTENGEILTLIQLPDSTNTEFLADKVGIITRHLRAMQRLPLDIIQTDEDGQKFIWVAQLNTTTALYSVIKHPITIAIQDDQYFEAQDAHKIPDGLIIITPDKKLNLEGNYVVAPVEIDAPLHDPIRQAWIDYEVYLLGVKKDLLAQRVQDCINGVNQDGDGTSGTSGGGSCGGTSNPDDIMFQIFQGLTQTDGTAGNACGSNTCGQ